MRHLIKYFIRGHFFQLPMHFFYLLVHSGQSLLVNFIRPSNRIIIPHQTFIFPLRRDTFQLLHIKRLPLQLNHFLIISSQFLYLHQLRLHYIISLRDSQLPILRLPYQLPQIFITTTSGHSFCDSFAAVGDGHVELAAVGGGGGAGSVAEMVVPFLFNNRCEARCPVDRQGFGVDLLV